MKPESKGLAWHPLVMHRALPSGSQTNNSADMAEGEARGTSDAAGGSGENYVKRRRHLGRSLSTEDFPTEGGQGRGRHRRQENSHANAWTVFRTATGLGSRKLPEETERGVEGVGADHRAPSTPFPGGWT